MEEESRIVVNISRKLGYKLKYLSEYDHEIAGWLIGNLKEGSLYCDDVIIPPQEATSVNVELDAEGMKWFIKNHKDKIKSIIGHWHSHNTMSATFSGGDEENHQKLIKGKKYFLCLVTSKGENGNFFKYEAKVLVTTPFKMEAEAIIEIEDEKAERIRKQIDKEVKAKVKFPEVKKYSGYGYYDDSEEETQTKLPSGMGLKKDDWVILRQNLSLEETEEISAFLDENYPKVNFHVLEKHGIYKIAIICKKKRRKEEILPHIDKILFKPKTKKNNSRYDDYNDYRDYWMY